MRITLAVVLITVILGLGAYFVPIKSRTYQALCTKPAGLKTRFNIMEKDAYDKAPVYYTNPGDELKDCAGEEGVLRLYFL